MHKKWVFALICFTAIKREANDR